MRIITQHLSSCDWLISLRVMSSGFIHAVTNWRASSFFILSTPRKAMSHCARHRTLELAELPVSPPVGREGQGGPDPVRRPSSLLTRRGTLDHHLRSLGISFLFCKTERSH